MTHSNNSNKATFLGVDPGLHGALAFYRPSDHALKLYEMPTKPKLRSSTRHEIDPHVVAQTILRYTGYLECALIEDVGAMTYVDAYGAKRGQGAAQSFAFGKSHGLVIGVLAAMAIPTYFVAPSVWKNLMGLSRDKNLSRQKAASLFPAHSKSFSRKKDNDKAEAALLAYFAAERFAKARTSFQ